VVDHGNEVSLRKEPAYVEKKEVGKEDIGDGRDEVN